MKTLKQVTKEYPEYKTIINSVIRKIGMNSVEDVINHGIAGGFNGFIHTSDTVKFWKSHKPPTQLSFGNHTKKTFCKWQKMCHLI